jgi:hypothetical protein
MDVGGNSAVGGVPLTEEESIKEQATIIEHGASHGLPKLEEK